MNRTEVIKFLNQAYRMDKLIEHDKRELKRLRDLSVVVGAIGYGDKVQNGGSGEDYSIIDRIMDKEQNVRLKIIEREQTIEKIKSTIDKLDDNFEKEILLLRHIEFANWYDIETLVAYSKRQCIRIYNKGVDNIQSILEAEKDGTQCHTDL